MSKILLVNNATAVAGAVAGTKDPTGVDPGRIAAFDADNFDGGTLNLAPTERTTAERVVFVQGGETPIFSPVFNVADIKASQINEAVYDAPVNQVTIVTITFGSETAGTATLRVVRADAGFMPHERVTVETEFDSTNDTVTDVVNALATAINNDSQTFVTATPAGSNILLTGNGGNISFETSLDGSTSNWTINVSNDPDIGNGTSDHVSAIEQLAYGGNYTNRIYLPVTPPSYVVAGAEYDLFTVRIPTNTTPNISSANRYVELILAVQTPATGIDLPKFFGV